MSQRLYPRRTLAVAYCCHAQHYLMLLVRAILVAVMLLIALLYFVRSLRCCGAMLTIADSLCCISLYWLRCVVVAQSICLLYLTVRYAVLFVQLCCRRDVTVFCAVACATDCFVNIQPLWRSVCVTTTVGLNNCAGTAGDPTKLLSTFPGKRVLCVLWRQ